MILSKEGAANPDHAVHGKSLKQAAQLCAAIVDEVGPPKDEDAAHAVLDYVVSRKVGAALKKGGQKDLVQRLDQFIRNSGDTSAYSWWQIGLTCAALEGGALSQKDRESNHSILERKLIESGIPKTVLTSLLEVRDQDRLQKLEAYLKEKVPEGFGGDLAILKAQHALGDFPDLDLLMRLGCSLEDIEYLRIQYSNRPKGVSDLTASGMVKVGVTAGAIQKRREGINKDVLNILLHKTTKTSAWSWRLPEDASYKDS